MTCNAPTEVELDLAVLKRFGPRLGLMCLSETEVDQLVAHLAAQAGAGDADAEQLLADLRRLSSRTKEINNDR